MVSNSSTAPALATAVGVRMRVIFALMLRETKTRYGRLRVGYIWALVEPILFVSIFFIIFSFAERVTPSGMPLIPFLITGVMPFILFRDGITGGMQAFRQNRALLTFPQVSLFDLVLARALLSFCTHFVAVSILIVGIVFVTGPLVIENVLGVIFWFTMAGVIGFGIGLAAGSFAVLMPTIEQLVNSLFIRPLFFISGIFFTAEMVPENVRNVALINPLFHLLELLRSSFFVGFESLYPDAKYVIFFTLAVVCFGMVTQRALRKRILMTPPG